MLSERGNHKNYPALSERVLKLPLRAYQYLLMHCKLIHGVVGIVVGVTDETDCSTRRGESQSVVREELVQEEYEWL